MNYDSSTEQSAWTAPSCSGKRSPCARVRVHRGPNPAPTRLSRRGDYGLVLPGSRASGPVHFRPRGAHAHSARPARRIPRRAGLGGRAGPRPPSPAGGVRTSAGRSRLSADVGSRTRSSWRRRAAPSGGCVSFLLRPTLPAARGGPAARSGPPAPIAPIAPRPAGGRSQRPAPGPPPRRRGHREPSLSGREPRGPVRGAAGRGRRRQDGCQAADPDGQREAQQEHHAARQRRQDLEKCPRREGVGRTLVIGSLHFCGLRLRNFPDYSEYQDGHVK